MKILGIAGTLVIALVVWKGFEYRKMIALMWDYMPFRRLSPQRRAEVNEMFR